MYSGESLPVVGQCVLPCMVNTKKVDVNFVIVDNEGSDAILGLKSCVEMNLVQRLGCNEINLQEFDDVFRGLGCLKDKHHITIDETVHPVVYSPRRIPHALREQVKEQLQSMVKDDIICCVNEPTQWVNAMCVVSKKNGKLRICMDPRDLNVAIRREHYQIPTAEEIVSRLGDARIMSVLDASQAFYHIPLDEESSKLCTMSTPFGRYRFKRLPYGIKSASEVFHRTITNLLENIEGAESFIDDILVWGRDREEHDNRLRAVLKTLRAANLTLNKAMC